MIFLIMIFTPFRKYNPKVGIYLCCLWLVYFINFTVVLLKFKALYYSWPEKKGNLNFISKYTFATRVGKLTP